MILSIASGLIAAEVSRWAADRSPLSSAQKESWNKVQLYLFIMLSLSVHVLLIGFGYASNKKAKRWFIILTWLAYYLGDWAATVALITLLRREIDKRQTNKINAIEMLWAPFLLLHLGTAETMAAHYLEETTLWLRYLVGLLIQFGMAFYIHFWFQNIPRGVELLVNLILAVGIMKCGERIWILNFSGFEKYKKQVLRAHPPEISHTYEGKFDFPKHEQLLAYLKRKGISEIAESLHQAYHSFKLFVPLFSGLKLRVYKNLQDIFTLQEPMSAEDAFRLVDIELEFLYDLLYNKTVIFNSVVGHILLCISLLLCISGVITFSIISKRGYPHLDIAITYLLLVVAIFTDTLALITQLCSKWTLRRWTKPGRKKLPKCLDPVFNCWLRHSKKGKGITSMEQSSLLQYCLKSKATTISAVAKKLHLGNTFFEKSLHKLDQKLQPRFWIDIGLELKDFIYFHLKKKRDQYAEKKFDFRSLSGLLNEGAYELLNREKLHEEVGWSFKDLEFTHSLLLWHIATDILYYDQQRRYPRGSFSPNCRISKQLSHYMMHLLIRAPFMFRKGIGELRYRDTCREAVKFLNENKIEGDRLAATTLLAINAECRGFLLQMRGQLGKSVFFAGSALAIRLRRLSREGWSSGDEKLRMDEEEVWELISCVWLEMLVSAANHCDWKDHEIQLRHDNELLTHVALLMAHLGLSKHIRMTDLPDELKALEPEGDYNPPWNWAELNLLAYYLA